MPTQPTIGGEGPELGVKCPGNAGWAFALSGVSAQRQSERVGCYRSCLLVTCPRAAPGMSFEQFKRMCSDKEFCEDIDETKLQLSEILKAVELHVSGMHRNPHR